jgi:putative Mg2+ transporter-C (MgtC) family protein
MPGSIEELFVMVFDSAACLGTAVLCGLIIGLEREKLDKPAGVRTHILVCLGSAVFVHLGVVAHRLEGFGTISDFNRLVQTVGMGIGFLGAGAIFRMGVSVKGVTTAASIWIMGAAGAAAGSGAVLLALMVSVIGYIVLRWMRFFDTRPPKKS